MSEHALTRVELADAVHRMVGLSHNESGHLVQNVLDMVMESLAAGEAVKISSFGTWMVREKAARAGRNPKTNAPAIIKSRRVVTFRASATLKKITNGENPGVEKDD